MTQLSKQTMNSFRDIPMRIQQHCRTYTNHTGLQDKETGHLTRTSMQYADKDWNRQEQETTEEQCTGTTQAPLGFLFFF